MSKRSDQHAGGSIPVWLQRHKRWIPWELAPAVKGGRPTKKPHGSTKNPEHWQTFDQVAELPRTTEGGIGFVFTGGVEMEGARLLALDLDACVFPGGELAPWAQEIVEQFGHGYTEISPSGYGLRLFVYVDDCPRSVPIINIGADSPVDKKPQIQVFGCGAAQYVTVTGDRLQGTATQPAALHDLSWLVEKYALAIEAERLDVEKPQGVGDAPGYDTIRERIGNVPGVAELLAGDWEQTGVPSASEGWHRLASAVLRAARGHVDAAAGFLLERTAYGSGQVDSRDPGKYQREDWVVGDLVRIHGKVFKQATDAFDDGFDLEAWMPPRRVRPRRLFRVPELEARMRAQGFLFKGLLPDQGLAQVYGPPGSGKSTVAVSLAAHTAAGRDWFGFECKRPGRVIYISGEGTRGLLRRLRGVARDLEELALLERVFVSDRSARVIDPADVKDWRDEIAAIAAEDPEQPISLIVVDTQARNFGPGNENQAEDMGKFVDGLSVLEQRFRTLVLVVHHTGHDHRERGRGSSAMGGALDVAIGVKPKRTRRALELVPQKAKDWDNPPPIHGYLRVVELGEDDDGDEITTVVFDAGAGELSLPDELSAIEPEHLALLELLRNLAGAAVTFDELADRLGCTRKQAINRIKKVCDAGWADRVGTPKNRSYPLTDDGFRIVPPSEGTMVDELLS